MIVDKLVEMAMRKAQGAEASLAETEATNVSFENCKLKSTSTSQNTAVKLRVIVDGRLGTSTTTDIHDLEGLVQRALDTAAFGSPAHFTFPAASPACEVKIYDPAIPPVTQTEMVQAGEAIVERIRAFNPEIMAFTRLGKHTAHATFANSSGAHFNEDQTYFYTNAFGQLVRGTEILFAGSGAGRKKRDIDPLAVADKAIAKFRMAERSASVPSAGMPVIFTPDGLFTLLMSLYLGVDAKNVQEGASPLAKKLGEKIAHESFTLIDNPLVDYAAGSGPYDDEGVPTRVLPMVEGGVLRNFLYDLETAGRAGVEPNGHGPWRWPTNWMIQPGNTPFAEMVKNTPSGLLVDDVLGLGQGNVMNGEFSLNVQLGYRIENGEITGRVKDVMIAGNAYEALKNIIALSSEQEWSSGYPGYYPYVQVEGVSVVSK